MNISQTTIILIVLGLVVLGAAGYLLFGRGEVGPAVSADAAPASAAELNFIGLTARLDPVEFDTSILTDERFAALRDIRTAIVPELSGRPDPFAPLTPSAPVGAPVKR